MKWICIICILFLFGCSGTETQQIKFADEFNYSFYDKTKSDSIHCIQVGSSSITPFNTIPLSFIKHELVDSTHAFVKILGKIVFINNEELTLKFVTDNDTISGELIEKTPSPSSFIDRTAVLNGEIQIHPQFSFRIDNYLVLNIKKAPIQKD